MLCLGSRQHALPPRPQRKLWVPAVRPRQGKSSVTSTRQQERADTACPASGACSVTQQTRHGPGAQTACSPAAEHEARGRGCPPCEEGGGGRPGPAGPGWAGTW